jgi:hypothetical protein
VRPNFWMQNLPEKTTARIEDRGSKIASVARKAILDLRSSIFDPRCLRVALSLALLICVAPLFLNRSSSTSAAQTLRERHARLRAALDGNDQAGAESLLRGMMENDPHAFARNNYDYLLGRLLQNRQAGAEAGAFFLRVVNRNSPLAGYALWHLAELARG